MKLVRQDNITDKQKVNKIFNLGASNTVCATLHKLIKYH